MEKNSCDPAVFQHQFDLICHLLDCFVFRVVSAKRFQPCGIHTGFAVQVTDDLCEVSLLNDKYLIPVIGCLFEFQSFQRCGKGRDLSNNGCRFGYQPSILIFFQCEFHLAHFRREFALIIDTEFDGA